MKCPHCLQSFHDNGTAEFVIRDTSGDWGVVHRICPDCGQAVIELIRGSYMPGVRKYAAIASRRLIHPKGIARAPLSPEIPAEFVEDYREACLVLADSPKASAALSRRCLQHVLRARAGVKNGDLANEIQQVLDSGSLPTHLAESIDAIRNVGNFSAHPMKSKSSGEILPVEPEEAEWNLEVLEGLFDFYFVQPAMTAKKKAALNEKLISAGKPPMK